MSCTFTLSANAGIVLEMAETKICIDLLHNTKTDTFSVVTPALIRAMMKRPAFMNPNAFIYTHCHPDHYSRELTEAARRLWPEAALYLPEHEFEGQIYVDGSQFQSHVGALDLTFIRVPHESPRFKDVRHYGILLSDGTHSVFVGGDIQYGAAELRALFAAQTVDLLVLPFPWLTLARARRELTEVLRPQHLLAYHVPFAEDDLANYRGAIFSSLKYLSSIPDIKVLSEPLQEVTVEF